MRGNSGCGLSNYYDLTLNIKTKVVYFVLTVIKRTGLESRQHKEEKFSLREQHILEVFHTSTSTRVLHGLDIPECFCLNEITIELMFSKSLIILEPSP